MIVMKFGGSSLESAKAIQRAASIVLHHLDRHPVVVVSAMGKTTDRLLAIARSSAAGDRHTASRELERLKEFHFREAVNLAGPGAVGLLEQDLALQFEDLARVLDDVAAAKALFPPLWDAVLSFGERLSSLIVTSALRRKGIGAVHVDARTVIVTDGRHNCANPLFAQTNALLRRKVSPDEITVMGGFIGATESGVTTTLGRGGSDYTAAIVGAAIDADEIQIWTDVDGILTCDPHLVSGAHCVRHVSYAEAEQLAKAGARVLHPATVLPAVKQRIPIVIRNSRNEVAAGTRITSDHNPACSGAVMSIACKSDIALLHLSRSNTPPTSEFGRTIWDFFQEEGVSFDLISPAVSRFTLIVESAALTSDFLNRLKALAEVTVEDGRALITLVGRNATSNGMNVVRASQRICHLEGGAMLACCTESRFAFVVAGGALQAAASALHEEFFRYPDPAIFIPDRYASSVVESRAGVRPRQVGISLASALRQASGASRLR